MIVLIGNTGNLARAILKLLKNRDIHVIPTNIARSWVVNHNALDLRHYISPNKIESIFFINTIGVVNPLKDPAELTRVNVDFPLAVASAIKGSSSTLVTLGSILEEFPNLSRSNPYLNSKLTLSSRLQEIKGLNFLHFRIHTWYGGSFLDPSMFLGKIINSIARNKPLIMSSGKQLREYHHIEDDVMRIVQAIKIDTRGLLQINHGAPIRLGQLAEEIFTHFNKKELLICDSNFTPPYENLDVRFEESPSFGLQPFRPLFPSILEYLERQIENEQA